MTYPNPDVPRLVRRALRAMGAGKPPEAIVQTWGREFVETFCARVSLSPAEFTAIAQLDARVARAEILSGPCQRWVAAWARSLELALAGATFDIFAVEFTDRHVALTVLANRAFGELLQSAGRAKIVEYLGALVITGELRQAPRDLDEN